MNPFAELKVSDDEDDFVQQVAADKPPKKSKHLLMKPTSNEKSTNKTRSMRRPKKHIRKQPKMHTTPFLPLKKTRTPKNTMLVPTNNSPRATTWTDKVEQAEMTDLASKEEEEVMSETSMMN